jgi:hypothetical protein
MKMHCLLAGLLALCLSLITATFARADFLPIGLPDANYLNSTTKIPITVPDFTNLDRLADANLTIRFFDTSSMQPLTMQARTPPKNWNTWSAPPFSEEPTPRVLFAGSNTTSVTLTFDKPVKTFGLEMEPNEFGFFHLTETFWDGPSTVGMITQNVNGFMGARLFAATTTTEEFTRVTLSAPGGSEGSVGFAIAEVRYSFASLPPIAEPSSLLLLGIGLVALLGYAWRHRKKFT